jgi:hypothetical protein
MPTGSLSRKKRLWIPILAVVFLTAASWIPSLALQHGERISKFGEYRGYSEAVYDSWVRTSRYLTMRDGTKIAIDIVRPAKEGKVHQQPLPVIWTHNRYRRAHKQGGKVISAVNSPLYAPLIRHGYIIANADVRGSGASFVIW